MRTEKTRTRFAPGNSAEALRNFQTFPPTPSNLETVGGYAHPLYLVCQLPSHE
jgi:hypothetical protein